jgi:hypothetical protein
MTHKGYGTTLHTSVNADIMAHKENILSSILLLNQTKKY